ncbi:tetratricopeptide repeat protein [Treponema primitia]|uniref:tetratricopeptide repeat protein n=1 Tax=Treponema primitia TaxID=88058 RepID=UPI0039810E91
MKPGKTPFLGALILLIAVPAFPESDFALRLAPYAVVPIGKEAEHFVPGFGIQAAADWVFFGLPTTKPFLGLRLGGGYSRISVETGSGFSFVDGKLGPLFQWRLKDRLSLWAELNGGIFQYQYEWNGYTDTRLRMGGSLGADIHLSPEIALYAAAGYDSYNFSPERSVDSLGINLGIRLSLSALFKRAAPIQGELIKQNRVFPVSYAWYEQNPVATLRVINNETVAITDVNLSFYLEQFMSRPAAFAVIPRLSPGETAELPVTALFNESMMELTENTTAGAQVQINYRALGSRKETSLDIGIPVYHRNAMNWDDDRRAASFVSARDPTAQLFARYVESVVNSRKRPGLSLHVQYALGLFEALNVYGMNYVIDPASSYVELSESSSSLDSLNYPYQTLFYRAGDCDDLSILYCSLLEVLGIDTAFITIPGHIYVAFAVGSNSGIGEDDLIRHGGQWWMPLEITVTNRGFFRAWRIGVQEWRRAGDEGRLYPTKDSWAIYPPVSVPDAAGRAPALPEETSLISALEKSLNTFGEFIIREPVRELEQGISQAYSGDVWDLNNKLGILYGRYGILDKAAAAFRRAGDKYGATNLGYIAFIEGRNTDAFRQYQGVIRREPEDVLAWLGIARSLYETGDFPQAEAAYADVLRSSPSLAGLYPYLGSYREWLGRPRSYADRLASIVWSQAIPMEELLKQALLKHEDPAPAEENPFPAFYLVKHQETLSYIAGLQFVYADSAQWPLLYEANKDILPEPASSNLTLPGLVLRIPSLNGEQRSGSR